MLIAFTFLFSVFRLLMIASSLASSYSCPTQFLPLLDLFFSSLFLFSSCILAPSNSWHFFHHQFPQSQLVSILVPLMNELFDWITSLMQLLSSQFPISHRKSSVSPVSSALKFSHLQLQLPIITTKWWCLLARKKPLKAWNREKFPWFGLVESRNCRRSSLALQVWAAANLLWITCTVAPCGQHCIRDGMFSIPL